MTCSWWKVPLHPNNAVEPQMHTDKHRSFGGNLSGPFILSAVRAE
jgi:hypothetical protein